jgi:hypothetical protein
MMQLARVEHSSKNKISLLGGTTMAMASYILIRIKTQDYACSFLQCQQKLILSKFF